MRSTHDVIQWSHLFHEKCGDEQAGSQVEERNISYELLARNAISRNMPVRGHYLKDISFRAEEQV